MMVMSGSGERVVFVFARPGDEALFSGGTIARLRSEGAEVAVIFGDGTGDGADVAARIDAALREAVERIHATAVVVDPADVELSDAVTRVADDAGVPVFLATHPSASPAERVIAIDVRDHFEEKVRALSHYGDRWSVSGAEVALPDGRVLPVGDSETYLRLEARTSPHGTPRPTPLARLGGSIAAAAVGVAFGVLGTIGHQSTLSIGSALIPVGLFLSLTAVTALLVGIRMILGDRLIVLACALGMLAAIFVLSLRSTGGSVLIPAGLPGTVWSVAPTLVAAVAVGWPKLPARR